MSRSAIKDALLGALLGVVLVSASPSGGVPIEFTVRGVIDQSISDGQPSSDIVSTLFGVPTSGTGLTGLGFLYSAKYESATAASPGFLVTNFPGAIFAGATVAIGSSYVIGINNVVVNNIQIFDSASTGASSISFQASGGGTNGVTGFTAPAVNTQLTMTGPPIPPVLPASFLQLAQFATSMQFELNVPASGGSNYKAIGTVTEIASGWTPATTRVCPCPPFPPPVITLPALTPLQFALLSDAAYGHPQLLPGYTEVPLEKLVPSMSLTPGFGAKVFTSADGSRVVLAIAGTDWHDIKDLIADASFANPFGVPTGQFGFYVDDAADILRALKDKEPYRNAEIVLTGHSLGGAIAQILASDTGLRATTFDSPGVALVLPTLDLSQLDSFPKPAAPQPITNYRMYGDLLSTAGTPLVAPITLAAPVSGIDNSNAFAAALHMHEMSIMIEQLGNNPQTLTDTGPTLASAAGTIAEKIVLAVSNQWLLDGIASRQVTSFIDPHGVDGYLLSAQDGSPFFKSILFPVLSERNALFRLELFTNGAWHSSGLFNQLTTYDFTGGGVDQFRFFVLDGDGLTPLFDLDPFTFGVTFVSEGAFHAQLSAFSSQSALQVPEPHTTSLFALTLLIMLAQYSRCSNKLRIRRSIHQRGRTHLG